MDSDDVKVAETASTSHSVIPYITLQRPPAGRLAGRASLPAPPAATSPRRARSPDVSVRPSVGLRRRGAQNGSPFHAIWREVTVVAGL